MGSFFARLASGSYTELCPEFCFAGFGLYPGVCLELPFLSLVNVSCSPTYSLTQSVSSDPSHVSCSSLVLIPLMFTCHRPFPLSSVYLLYSKFPPQSTLWTEHLTQLLEQSKPSVTAEETNALYHSSSVTVL